MIWEKGKDLHWEKQPWFNWKCKSMVMNDATDAHQRMSLTLVLNVNNIQSIIPVDQKNINRQ